EYANANNIVLISQGSTASSLAIPNDALFRLAPNDRREGAGIAALRRADGIDTLVEIWRDDAGNAGLATSTKTSFLAGGGTVSTEIHHRVCTWGFAVPVR